MIGELGKRGYAVVDEPGRRIVKEELASGGAALPWVGGIALARRGPLLIEQQRIRWMAGCFRRGLIDAAAALRDLATTPIANKLTIARPATRRDARH